MKARGLQPETTLVPASPALSYEHLPSVAFGDGLVLARGGFGTATAQAVDAVASSHLVAGLEIVDCGLYLEVKLSIIRSDALGRNQLVISSFSPSPISRAVDFELDTEERQVDLGDLARRRVQIKVANIVRVNERALIESCSPFEENPQA